MQVKKKLRLEILIIKYTINENTTKNGIRLFLNHQLNAKSIKKIDEKLWKVIW